MSQESYDRVGQAAVNLRAAQRAFLEARYENYRQRLVSPREAYTVAAQDLVEVSTHGLEHTCTTFTSRHDEEINR